MAGITRRRLLGRAAGVAGGALAATALPPNLRKAIAAGPPKHGSFRDIEHVVILMQENRSFDHYFGTMAGVRGFGDPDALTLSTGRSVFYQPDAVNPDGYLLPFHLDTKHTSSQAIPSTSHAWTVQHSAINNGKMDNWLPAHRAADGNANGPYTMSYYERDDIPFHWALAENFTICDGYHCSLLGPTWPNRLYHLTGTIDPDGLNGGPIISNVVPKPYTWTTYPERLTKAGVSWHVYQGEDDYGCNPLEFFQQFQNAKPGDPLYEHGLTISPTDKFEEDVRNHKLPFVSWLVPTSGQSEHPSYLPASGADFVASKIDAIAADPEIWSKTVFILNYDENDGLFDHVPPPLPPPGTPEEFVGGLPIGGGIRVPCFVVSPWSMGGWVATENFDHTSVLRFLETLTGVEEPNISAWRRQTFGDLTSALGIEGKRPFTAPFPVLPDTKSEFWQAEQEVATLPPTTLPGAQQTPPKQEKGKRPVVPAAAAAAALASAATASRAGALPETKSRLEETRTTHRSDFPDGTKDSMFPGVLAAIEGHSAAVGVTHAYVPGIAGGNVALIDTTTHAAVSSIGGQTNPYGIVATPDGTKLYVTQAGSNLVDVISTATNKVTTKIVVGVYPRGIAVSPDGSHVYVADTGPDTGPGGSRTVSVISTATDMVTATWDVGETPQIVAVAPNGRTLYVTTADGLIAVDTTTGRVRGRVPEITTAHGVGVHPSGETVWVVDTENDRVLIIDGFFRISGLVPVGRNPWNIAFSSDGLTAYATNTNEDTVSVVDTRRQRVVTKVAVGHIPTGISVTGTDVWVACNTSSTVSVIDGTTNTVKATVTLGLVDEPTTIAFA